MSGMQDVEATPRDPLVLGGVTATMALLGLTGSVDTGASGPWARAG